MLADLLLQGFGVAGALPGLAMLAWAWRIASHRGRRQHGGAAGRAAGGAAGAGGGAGRHSGCRRTLAWPTVAGLGGAVGALLGDAGWPPAARAWAGRRASLVWRWAWRWRVTLTLLALGLSAGEWRAAGRGAGRAARYGVSGGRRRPLAGAARGSACLLAC